MGGADAGDPGTVVGARGTGAVKERAWMEIYPQYVRDTEYYLHSGDRADLPEPVQPVPGCYHGDLQYDCAGKRCERVGK